MDRMSVIEMSNVWKYFGKGKNKRAVLKSVDLNIDKGEFVVVAGKNGSGKSTLIKLMVGLLIPDQGKIRVLGMDTVKYWKGIAKEIGVVLAGDRGLYWKLTGVQNLEVFGGLYNVPKRELKERIDHLLSLFNLAEFSNERVENYSTGMRRKLLLAKALIHKPKILFLDEIFSGIDPKSYKDILEILLNLNQEGHTIVMVSHTLHELPRNFRILILKNGKITYDGKISDILINTKVRIVAIINGREVIYDTDEQGIMETMKKITALKPTNIKIERETIYDVVREHI